MITALLEFDLFLIVATDSSSNRKQLMEFLYVSTSIGCTDTSLDLGFGLSHPPKGFFHTSSSLPILF
jgi:hypothetical protein